MVAMETPNIQLDMSVAFIKLVTSRHNKLAQSSCRESMNRKRSFF